MNIYTYIFRRILYVIPVLLGVCAIIFFLFNVVSPDPTQIMLGKHASLEQMEELRKNLGFNSDHLSFKVFQKLRDLKDNY